SPDGTLMASGGRGNVNLWNVSTREGLLSLNSPDFVSQVTFSPDGMFLAVSGQGINARSPRIDLWKLENGRGIRTLRGLSHPVTKLAFSQNGNRVAALDQSFEVGVWDIPALRLLWTAQLRQSDWSADNAALSLDSSGSCLVASAGTQVKIWEVSSA